MLRYKTETRPGLVALYDIRPGNGAGQFLQPRSPQGAVLRKISSRSLNIWESSAPKNLFSAYNSGRLAKISALYRERPCVRIGMAVKNHNIDCYPIPVR